MSYYGTAMSRRRVLDKAKLQILSPKDQKMIDSMDLADWNFSFDILNNRFFSGKLPKIEVVFIPLSHKKSFGTYYHQSGNTVGTRIEISSDCGRTNLQLLGTLLHEMCHHSIHTKYGYGKKFGLKEKKKVIGHGKQWKTEMQRVGFLGKITKYSGKERFAHLKWHAGDIEI